MRIHRYVLALCALNAALPAFAQNYPSKAVRFVCPYPPGGSVDVVGRLIGAGLVELLGQQFIVDNRSGASGSIGTEHVARSPADGYTLLVQSIPFVSNQFLLARTGYDPIKDFAPISQVTAAPSLVTVHPSLPVRSIKELIALAKAKPGQLNYSSAGIGTNPHIAGELFNLLAGVNLVVVHYKGGGPADMAVISGEAQLTFNNISQQVGYVQAGRLRALAVTSIKRNPTFPDVPTVAEAGVPGYEFMTWHGILAPRATPRPVVMLLHDNIKKVMTGPGQVKQWQDRGLDVVASSPEEFGAHLEREQKKWGQVIKQRGIKAE